MVKGLAMVAPIAEDIYHGRFDKEGDAVGSGSGAATGKRPQDVNVPGPNGEAGHFEIEEYADSDANYGRQVWVADPVEEPVAPDPEPTPSPQPGGGGTNNDDPPYWIKRKSTLGMASLIG